MSDPIYEVYSADTNERKNILRALRAMARRAGLDKHGVPIRPSKSIARDDVEVRADLFAEEMKNKPHLHSRLQGNAKVSAIADIDFESFPNGRRKIVGTRATGAVTGRRKEMPGKAARNRNEGHRLGIEVKAAGSEVSSGKGRPALGFELNDNMPIDPSKRIRDVTVSDIRAPLDLHGCDGVTAFKILTLAVFAKYSHKLSLKMSPPSPRGNKGGPDGRQAEMKLGTPEC